MKVLKKYKFIEMRIIENEVHDGHPVYRIFNIKEKIADRAELGMIFYYRQWKQFVFRGRDEALFNNSCLNDVIDFINNHAGRIEP
jgi:hypothetical protein